MPRRPEIGNIQLYPDRPLKKSDKNGYVLKFYCPIRKKRIRRNSGTRDRREARRILRECRERLLNGDYERSAGAITAEVEKASTTPLLPAIEAGNEGSKSWQECFERYRRYHKNRVRKSTHRDAIYGIQIAERIFENHREVEGFPEGLPVQPMMTLDMLEFLQDRLLDGEECRYERRSSHTVNSMVAVVMAFVRYCYDRDWIEKIPRLQKIDTDDVMKGRPVTTEEFERMIQATPSVVGESSAPSWQFALRILWESGFRIGDLMDFHWEDERHIHPKWSTRKGQHPTIIIPSTQKNGRNQEIPMLPGLQKMLEDVPKRDSVGWVLNPIPMEYKISGLGEWYQPGPERLARLVSEYCNCAIAEACSVSEATVRKWLNRYDIHRSEKVIEPGLRLSKKEVNKLRKEARKRHGCTAKRSIDRLSENHVGRVISKIGEAANVVVQHAHEESGKRMKYASSHDLRRGCAERLINAGVSAETLKVIFRHSSFSTTERYYGASRSAQSAAKEVTDKLSATETSPLVGGLMGGIEDSSTLDPDEVVKLKSLLASL